jgi:tRNA A-37 threonylcarbamoyl transferase component Bud32
MVALCPMCGKQFSDAVYCPTDGVRLVPEHEGQDRVGKTIDDRYRIVRKVGQGGSGEVFEAEHIYIRKRVALKLLRSQLPSRAEAIQRLRREAQATSAIGHPGIVEIEDFGTTEDGVVFMAMEWLEGEPLDVAIERGPMPVERALTIALQVCEALAAAHDAGVIHRDLKPENIFLTRTPAGEQAKILDFGVAKVTTEDARLTATGMVVGTPYYIAPEQAAGRDVDGRSDIYAVGVILYEMLTGTLPFTASNAMAVVRMHLEQEPQPPRKRAPAQGIPVEVEAVILRCMTKKPAGRYESARALADALRALPGALALGQAVTAAAPVPAGPSAGTTAGVAPGLAPGQTTLKGAPVGPAAAVNPGTTPGAKAEAPGKHDDVARTALVGERAEQRRGRFLLVLLGLALGLGVGALTFALVRSARQAGDPDDRATAPVADAGAASGTGRAGAVDAGPAGVPPAIDAAPAPRPDATRRAPVDAGGIADAAPRPRPGNAPDASPGGRGGRPPRPGSGPDASVGNAPDAAGAWRFADKTRNFDYEVIVTPASVQAGQPFTLEIGIVEAIDDIRIPLLAGKVRAELAFLHFTNHQRTNGGALRVSKDGVLRKRMTLPRDGKYHVALALIARGKRFPVQFDICVGADPRTRAAGRVCPRLNRR